MYVPNLTIFQIF